MSPRFLGFGLPVSTPMAPTAPTAPRAKSKPKLVLPPMNPLDSPLLSLPSEIRLKIYFYVIATHPATHVHLSPSYVCPLSIFAPQGRSEPLTLTALTCTPSPSPRFSKRIGYVPSALLRSCRQIYLEARDLPFENCEFTFMNWFCSGVFAAQSFLRGLREWQAERVRWAGLEVLGRDLVGVGTGCGLKGSEKLRAEWEEICGLLHGVWGLRLVVKGRVEGDVVYEAVSVDGDADGQVDNNKADTQWIEDVVQTQVVRVLKNCVLDTENTWVREGLAKMAELKWLELYIEDDHCSLGQKEEFCEQLRSILGVQVLLTGAKENVEEIHEGDTPVEEVVIS